MAHTNANNKSPANETAPDKAVDRNQDAIAQDTPVSPTVGGGNHALSQAEMNALLSGLGGTATDSLTCGDHSRHLQPRQFQVLKHCHDVLCRQLSIDWQQLIGSPINASLTSIEEHKYETFTGMLDESCIAVVELNKASGQLMLAIEQSVLLPIVQCMLGSSDQRNSQSIQPLTKVELKLASRAIESLLSLYEQAWSESSFQLELGDVTNGLPEVSITLPDEYVAVATLKLEIGQSTGQCQVAWPLELLAELIPTSAALQSESAEQTQQASQVSVRLPTFEFNKQSLDNLEVGQILQTEINAESPVEVHVNQQPKFVGSLGAVNKNKAVRLTSDNMSNEPPEENGEK